VTRLDQFLDVDDAARDRAAIISSLVGAAAFVLGKTLLDLEGKALGWFTIGAVGLAYALRVWWYCWTAEREPARNDGVFLTPRRFAMGALSAGFVALLRSRPPAVAEASLDRTLLALTSDKDLSPTQAREVASALDVAIAGRIKVPDGTRIQVYHAVKDSGLKHPDSEPFIDSGNGIVRYTRKIAFARDVDSNVSARSKEARTALGLGLSYANSVFLSSPTAPGADKEDASRAVSEFTRAIELSTQDGEKNLSIRARTMRASMYLYLHMPNDALADARSLESNGDTDLSNVLAIEGAALFMRGERQDLEQSIRLFTLLTNLDLPTWASDPTRAAILRIDAFGNRGKAYYKLGEYQKCIEDTQRLLDLISESQRTLDLSYDYYLKGAYLAIISSYLQLGNLEQAKKNAEAWLAKSGDPIARRVVAEMESDRFNREGWLKEYMEIPEQ
jgi:hypothetical protein